MKFWLKTGNGILFCKYFYIHIFFLFYNKVMSTFKEGFDKSVYSFSELEKLLNSRSVCGTVYVNGSLALFFCASFLCFALFFVWSSCLNSSLIWCSCLHHITFILIWPEECSYCFLSINENSPGLDIFLSSYFIMLYVLA